MAKKNPPAATPPPEEPVSAPVEPQPETAAATPQEIIASPGDKVTYGAGRKISDDKYGSYDFHVSISTEIRAGETAGTAIKRSINFVEKVLEHKAGQMRERRLRY